MQPRRPPPAPAHHLSLTHAITPAKGLQTLLIDGQEAAVQPYRDDAIDYAHLRRTNWYASVTKAGVRRPLVLCLDDGLLSSLG